MNTGFVAPRKMSSEAPRTSRCAGSQLSLPLEIDFKDEDALRAAWKRCGLRVPYHVALRTRPLAICLNCLADAMQRKAGTDSCPAEGGRSSKRRRK